MPSIIAFLHHIMYGRLIKMSNFIVTYLNCMRQLLLHNGRCVRVLQ